MNHTPLDLSAGSAVVQALSSAIDLHGPSLLREPDRLKVYLDQHCPNATREIALIVAAITEGVPQAMLAAHSDDDLEVLLPRLVKRLIERAAIEPASATWAVRTWAHALAVSSSVLDGGRIAETRAAAPVATQRSSAAEVLRVATPAVQHVARPPMHAEASTPAVVSSLAAKTDDVADEHHEQAAHANSALEPDVVSPGALASRVEKTVEARSDADDGIRVETEIESVAAFDARAEPNGADEIAVSHSQPPSSNSRGRPLGYVWKIAATVAAVVAVIVAVRWGLPPSPPIEAASEKVAVSPQKIPSTPPALQPEAAPRAEVASPSAPAPSPASSAAPVPQPAREAPTASTPIASAPPPAAKATRSSSTRPTTQAARPDPRRATPAVAAAPTARASAECTRSTCGSVVAARTIDDDSAGKSSGQAARNYAITIRMDDRSIHTLVQSLRWQPGMRVQMTGNRFAPIDASKSVR